MWNASDQLADAYVDANPYRSADKVAATLIRVATENAWFEAMTERYPLEVEEDRMAAFQKMNRVIAYLAKRIYSYEPADPRTA